MLYDIKMTKWFKGIAWKTC